MMSSHSRGLFMIGITALLWGVLAIVLQYSLHFLSVNAIIWFRFLLACIFLIIYYAIRDPSAFVILARPPILGIIAGICISGNYYGFTVGLDLTTPSNAQILIQLSPLLVAAIGIFYFKERLTRLQVLGFSIAAIGFILFYWDQIHHLVTTQDRYFKGNLWVFFAAVCWAVFAVCQKVLLRIWTPLQTNLLFYIVASLLFTPYVNFKEFLNLTEWTQWAALIFMAANTLIAYAALAEALRLLPANQVSAIIVLNPLITLAVAAELSRRQISWMPAENISLLGYLGALGLLIGVGFVVKKQ
ncbi:DMT family transporter [Desulfatirhabdium butyrativorans]|uniref:DMT family transporter n=1 Tax=Desulfatirhabdium butyrativorans TaxID=340467 RepID=UPI0004182852|nr:DMT family transporter [Desulfatirhabdium butyrativorans]